jgi:copper homeostasis protein
MTATAAVPLLEVAAGSLDSALAAQAGGAGRVELCTGLELGGLTPSPALISIARDRLRIPLYVLIRPRAGDFVYSDSECEVMLGDIEHCVRAGCDGVVLGVLDAQGDLDRARCQALIDAAGPLGVTLHRAFDLTRDPAAALEAAIALGCERLLTSGTQARAIDGAATIRALLAQAAGRIGVMPGAGVDSGNIAALAAATGAREFHASAKRVRPSGMRYPARLADMAAGEWRTDVAEVCAMVDALRRLGAAP